MKIKNMLTKPYLAKCSDRTSMPKEHPTSGSPEDWFSNSVLQRHGLIGLTFDFFVDWSKNPSSLKPVVWVKRSLSSPHTYNRLIEDLHKNLVMEFGIGFLTRLASFASNYQLLVQFVIYRDDFNWGDETSEILLVNLLNSNNKILFDNRIISVRQLKDLIKQNSGGPIRVGSKGLIYGTSRLECFLSKTDSLYPGDADLVIIDAENKPKAILEFKKHTLQSPILNQALSNYYPYPDGRKYDRLAILQEYLSRSGEHVPLLVLYYPTNGAFKEGRVELLQGTIGKLSARAAGNFNLPIRGSLENYDSIVSKIKNAIAYSKRVD